MAKKLFGRDLGDTPFSQDRLIIWTLGFSVVSSLTYIFVLAYQRKEIPPSLAMAAGIVISEFARSLRKGRQ